MNDSLRSFCIRFIVSLILIAVLYVFVDFSEIHSILTSINAVYVFVTLCLVTVDRILMSIKWNILLRARDVNIPLLEIVKTYYIGNFLGIFGPSTVGVDLTRAWHLAKRKQDLSKIASSIMMERMLGLVVLSVFSLAAVAMFTSRLGTDLSRFTWLNLLITVVLLMVFVISISEGTRSFLESGLDLLGDNAFFAKLKRAYSSYQDYRNSKTDLLLFSVLTFAELFVPIAANYFTALALNLDLPFAYFITIIPPVLFLSRIPVSLSGIGVQEGLFVVLFSFVNVTPSQAFLMGLLAHVLTILGLMPGLIFYLLDPIKRRKPYAI